jgi:copper chaperone CopZ
MSIVIKVPDMSCSHCEMAIQNALKELKDIMYVQIDLNSKIVRVEGEVESEEVMNQIKNAGYLPQKLSG